MRETNLPMRSDAPRAISGGLDGAGALGASDAPGIHGAAGASNAATILGVPGDAEGRGALGASGTADDRDALGARRTSGGRKLSLCHTPRPRGLGRRAFLAVCAALPLVALSGCGRGVTDGGAPATGAASDGAAPAGGADGLQDALGFAASSRSDAAVVSSASSDADGVQPATAAFFAFDTLVQLSAYGASDELVAQIQRDCARYEQLFSARIDTSDVCRINAAGGKPVEVDPDTADLISASLELCKRTGGALDITIGAASLLWDFQQAVKPADDVLTEAARHIDYRGVSVDGTTVTLSDPAARLDLGGVAKGWIAQAITDSLMSAGVRSALINLGTSSVYALGTKPDGTPWGIGLRDPRNSMAALTGDASGLLGKVSVSDRALVTSGLYDQHFEQDGTDYWHILDPATGYPVQTDLAAVSVVLPSSLAGDALSTALFVMGSDAARAWLADNADLQAEALFIDGDDDVTFTEGFEATYAYVPLAGEGA